MFFSLFSGMDIMTILMMSLYRIPGIMIGMAFHEFAHAYAANKLGDPTAKNLGRMTLDPLKHLDPIGVIMLVVFGFGWAKPVMVNPRNFKKLRRDDTIVSLAGVTANLIVAFIITGIMVIFFKTSYFNLFAFYSTSVQDILYNVLYFTLVINLSLAVFNLIPVPPLDGYHVFKNIFIRLGPQFFWNYERYGQIILMIIIFSGGASQTIGFLINSLQSAFNGFFSLFI